MKHMKHKWNKACVVYSSWTTPITKRGSGEINKWDNDPFSTPSDFSNLVWRVKKQDLSDPNLNSSISSHKRFTHWEDEWNNYSLFLEMKQQNELYFSVIWRHLKSLKINLQTLDSSWQPHSVKCYYFKMTKWDGLNKHMHTHSVSSAFRSTEVNSSNLRIWWGLHLIKLIIMNL